MVKDIPVIFGKKGRTTIPLTLRRKLGWQAGDTIRYRLDGENVVISRDRSPAQPAQQNPAAQARNVLPLVLALLLGGEDSG